MVICLVVLGMASQTWAQAEIAVQRNGGIPDGGTDGVGAVVIGTTRTLVYGVNNIGDADLTLGPNAVTVLNERNCTLRIRRQPGEVVAPSLNTTFELLLTPNAAGDFSAEVQLGNDVAPYDFTVEGTGTAPAPSLSIMAESSFDASHANEPVVRVWELGNVGQAELNITEITSDRSEFTMGGLALPATLRVGQKADLMVTFTPGSDPFVSATVEIVSDTGGVQGTVTTQAVSGRAMQSEDDDAGGCAALSVPHPLIIVVCCSVLLIRRRAWAATVQRYCQRG